MKKRERLLRHASSISHAAFDDERLGQTRSPVKKQMWRLLSGWASWINPDMHLYRADLSKRHTRPQLDRFDKLEKRRSRDRI
jgi:hypothetical protein